MKIQDIVSSDILFKNKADITHEPLNGGFSNETHLVTCGDEKFVVKINYPQNEYLHLSRKTELQAQRKAADFGIAPKVLSCTNTETYSISEFIHGHLMTNEEILQEHTIVQLASHMKKIHSIRGIDRTCSAFDLIDGYVRGINEFKVQVPDGYSDIMHKTEMIRSRRSNDHVNNNKYCHNDLLGLNLLFDGEKITVIDWFVLMT